MSKDMTQGSPGKTLFLFAVPMVLGNLFQQLYNIVDSVIVGNFVGSDALAAVGASTSITFLLIALASGASIGSSVVISQLFGARKLGHMKTAIYTALISAFLLSFFLMILGSLFSDFILKLMKTPDNIFSDASAYLKIYFFGAVFLFMYNILNSVFNALGDSRTPLLFLIFSSLLNIGLDLLFVTQFSMGVAGVAWATLISQGLSAVLSFFALFYKIISMKIQEKFRFYEWESLKNICRIAIPSTIQQSIVSLGMIFVQTLVNSYGSVVMAGFTAATKIDNIAIMPMVNIGNAVSTFTGQNIGAGKVERVKEGLKMAMIMVLVVAFTTTGILFLFGDVFVGLFVDSTFNQDVIAVGIDYLRVVSLFYVIMGMMNNCNGILRGAGDVKVFMLGTLSNFATRVILAYVLSPFFGAAAIWWAVPIGWWVGLTIAFTRFKSGKWKEATNIQ